MRMARGLFMALLALAAMAAFSARAQSDGDRYSIMRPEPGMPPDLPHPDLMPTYKSPRGTRLHVKPVRPITPPQRGAETPPPIYVPESGRTLPNLPTVSPSGPGGRETYQDRAARCAHQSGVYGSAVGNPGAYIGSCVNQ